MHADFGVLADLGLIFAVAVVMALILARLSLPAVLAYVSTGFILGPAGFGWMERHGVLEFLAEIGVVLLLFTVGLEFSLAEMKRSWRTVVLAGGLQVALTVAGAAAVAMATGRSFEVALTWGFLVSLSSTAVILRLLDARGETKAGHGRLVVGVLIFQDLCLVPMMLLLPLLAGDGGGVGTVVAVLLKAVAIVALIVVGARAVVPRAMRQVAKARNREVFLLAVLAIAGITAYVTSLTGLSLALGAFLAGMILADTQYSHQALADVLPIRAVMMCVFFVTIGMLIDLDTVRARPGAVAGVFGTVVAGKFLVMTLTGLILRFPLKIAALAGAALAQVGEFSFVLAGAAESHGLLSGEEAKVFLAASVLTIAVAPIAVALSPRLLAGSAALAPLERILDGKALPENVEPVIEDGHVVLAGLGVGGRAIVESLERVGLAPVIVELNPETVATERRRGRRVVFGDITSHDVLRHAGVERARALVLVVSDLAATHRAAEVARELNPTLPILIRTRFASDEGGERRPGMHVLSEEFSGALAMAGLVLQRCGVEDWSAVVGQLVSEHEHLPPDEEGQLGPPPQLRAAELASSRRA